jgi:hypothetical protein
MVTLPLHLTSNRKSVLHVTLLVPLAPIRPTNAPLAQPL